MSYKPKEPNHENLIHAITFMYEDATITAEEAVLLLIIHNSCYDGASFSSYTDKQFSTAWRRPIFEIEKTLRRLEDKGLIKVERHGDGKSELLRGFRHTSLAFGF